jgi:asparagine synthase (glutamine-hydrolysing)
MCGIVGVVSATPVDQPLVEKMRDQLSHRGPDYAGVWSSNDGHICLGHRRLAIVDLRPESNQPFISSDGRFVLTFNGEIYNFQSLRDELTARGVTFRTRSDTEVLMEAYRAWGPASLERLSGMFSFALWDSLERRLFCARDRAGEKPFYYTVVDDAFLFASEIKALVLWPGFRRDINYPALVDFLSFGFTVEPKTIWEGCHKLPAGHWMIVDLPVSGAPRLHDPVPYWDMEFNPDYSIRDWESVILDTLQAASVEMSFADVPVGTFLSGGVDSSSIAAALSKAGRSVNTFTVGFEEQEYDERSWARQVAQQYKTNHTERVVHAEDVTAVFDKMLWHYDEPFNDYSYLPTYYVCREARKVITVALSGDGGDEVFAGYRKYQRLGLRQNVDHYLPLLRPLLLAGSDALLPETSRFRRTLQQYGMDAPAMLVDTLTTGFSLATLRQVARGPLAAALKHYTPFDAVIPLLHRAPPERVGLINTMRYLDLKLTLEGDILVKVDRASMAVSLEVRPVYLHRDMMTLAARIPPEQLADRQQAKKVLKSALRRWLPDETLYRRKQGFAMPLGQWLRGDLKDSFEPTHSPDALTDVIDSTALERRLSLQHANGTDQTSAVHSLFFLKHWTAKWVNSEPHVESLLPAEPTK